MKGRTATRLTTVGLLLMVALATVAGHSERWKWSPGGVGAQSHSHGPFGQCPAVAQHHCLICAAGHFAPAPSVARLTPPQVRHPESGRQDPADSGQPVPSRVGRSPPARAL